MVSQFHAFINVTHLTFEVTETKYLLMSYCRNLTFQKRCYTVTHEGFFATVPPWRKENSPGVFTVQPAAFPQPAPAPAQGKG